MKGLTLQVVAHNRNDLALAFRAAAEAVHAGAVLELAIKPFRRKRSLSQNAFQHVIYDEVSKYLIRHGRKDWTPEYTKIQLKNKFLGWERREFVDVMTGEITVREVLRSTAGLDTGQAYHYTTQLLEWAEWIGCPVRIPAVCEYRTLMEQQTA